MALCVIILHHINFPSVHILFQAAAAMSTTTLWLDAPEPSPAPTVEREVLAHYLRNMRMDARAARAEVHRDLQEAHAHHLDMLEREKQEKQLLKHSMSGFHS